jgi:hypothetical protein
MNFQAIINYFKSFGLNVSESTDPLLLLLCILVILSVIALLCVLNILLYGVIVYMFADKARLERFTKNLPPFLMYILNIYKKTRLVYIFYEVLLLLVCLLSIIWLGGRVIIATLL